MMLVWLPKAIENRDALIDHIALDDPKAAAEQDSHIDRQSDLLTANPEIGRAGRKQGTRELVISNTSFVLIYRLRLKTKRIEILRVLHTSQAWPA